MTETEYKLTLENINLKRELLKLQSRLMQLEYDALGRFEAELVKPEPQGKENGTDNVQG